MKAFSGPNGVLEFTEAACDVFERFAQVDDTAPEAGGLLLGRLIVGTNHVVVDRSTHPSESDQRGRFWFRRSRPASQVHVNAAWQMSGGTQVYLGEWHTHPEDDPVPSFQDNRDRRRILKRTQCEQDSLLFVIVGRQRIRVWEGSRLTLAVRELGVLSQ